MKLNLTSNEHTEEALKHVYALLFANKDIIVEINDPHSAAELKNMQSVTSNGIT